MAKEKKTVHIFLWYSVKGLLSSPLKSQTKKKEQILQP